MKLFKAIFLCFLLLFLGLNFSATASRSFKWTKHEDAVKELHYQDITEKRAEGSMNIGDELMERRMDFESTDYAGTGANNHHDPTSPGRP